MLLIRLSKRVFAAVFLILFPETSFIFGNNIQISNVQITEKNLVEQWVSIRFDMYIERGWRINTGASNWSAVWLFVKYQVDNGEWHHATLSTNSADYTMPVNVMASPVSDGKGVFIYDSRVNPGTYSSYTVPGLLIRWKYGLDGVSSTSSNVNVKVLGMEMVYVPSGSFSLGSGGNETNHFFTQGSNNPYLVSSDDQIIVGNSSGNLNYSADNLFSGDRNGPIPASYPKGYGAYYMMRYEISQEQYVDFLNLLTRQQQINLTNSNISGSTVTNYFVLSNSTNVVKRNGIRCNAAIDPVNPVVFYCDYNNNGVYNEAGDGQNIACNFLDWNKLIAYLDWSGLRPMTELEYEKSCRGTAVPVANEYAWGTIEILQSSASLTNSGFNSEITTNSGNGLCNYDHIDLPMRVGFAARSSTNRVQAGAGFYGACDLSGNITERCVTAGSPAGRAYTGLHGDGELSGTGSANVLNWPGPNGTSARGGNYASTSDYLRVSARNTGFDWLWFFSNDESGGRGVRSAN
ncbi:MAG: SUMF1/EgtB/PvdO family nonheme iron enzyme [Bacteroidales bacterium]